MFGPPPMHFDHTTPLHTSRIIAEGTCAPCGTPLRQRPVRLIHLESEPDLWPLFNCWHLSMVVAVHESCPAPMTLVEAYSGEYVQVASAAWRIDGLNIDGLNVEVGYEHEAGCEADPLAAHVRNMIRENIEKFLAALVDAFLQRLRTDPWPTAGADVVLPPAPEAAPSEPGAATTQPLRISRVEIDAALDQNDLRARAEPRDITALTPHT